MAVDIEYQNFITWLKQQFGGYDFFAPGQANYKNSSLYQQWLKIGRPSKTVPTESLQPSQTPTSPTLPVPFTRQGDYILIPQYDLSGKVTGYNWEYNPQQNTGISPYQQGQLDISREQLAFQREQAGQSLRERQMSLQTQAEQTRTAYMQNLLQGGRGSPEAQAQMYEQIRSDILGSIQQPRNWIQYLQVKNAPNPFVQENTPDQRLEQLQADYKIAQSAAKIVKERLKDLNDPLTPSKIENPQSAEENLAKAVLDRERQLADQLLNTQVAMGQGAAQGGKLSPGWLPTEGTISMAEAEESARQGYYATPRPNPASPGDFMVGEESAPGPKGVLPVPEWLPQFVPELRGKQFLEEAPKAQVTRPSAQSWLQLPEAKAEMLAGYAGYAGQDWNEMLRQMALERPLAAPVPRRTTAFRQR